MPIVDIEVVAGTVPDPEVIGKENLQILADALGSLFGGDPGGTWVRIRSIDQDSYAENHTVKGTWPPPTFVSVLRIELPEPDALRREMKKVAEIVARTLGRPRENVHVLYEHGARGRIGFGGTLRG